jgi:hypothetical protein
MTEARCTVSTLPCTYMLCKDIEWYKKVGVRHEITETSHSIIVLKHIHTFTMPSYTCSSSLDLVLSHTSSTTHLVGSLHATNGDTGKDPGYIVLNKGNGDTGKDPGARETESEDINTLLFACCGDRSSSMA